MYINRRVIDGQNGESLHAAGRRPDTGSARSGGSSVDKNLAASEVLEAAI